MNDQCFFLCVTNVYCAGQMYCLSVSVYSLCTFMNAYILCQSLYTVSVCVCVYVYILLVTVCVILQLSL